MNDRILLRLHVEAVWGLSLPQIGETLDEVTVSAGSPPWSLFLATLERSTRVAIWRADAPPSQRPSLLAQAAAAGPTWDARTQMRREVVFAAPETTPPGIGVARTRVLGDADADVLDTFAFGSAAHYLDPRAAPCVGVIAEGRLVSVAHSARQTSGACELGVDTLAEARRRGHAQAAVARWTALVWEGGHTPIYSAFAWNEASLRLAQSAGYVRRIEGAYGPVPEASA